MSDSGQSMRELLNKVGAASSGKPAAAKPVSEKPTSTKKKLSESTDEVAGWIAVYNGKKLEIKKGTDADDLYSAKKFAVQTLKVPKSKWNLIAIKPAYNESVEEADDRDKHDLYDKRPGSPYDTGKYDVMSGQEFDPHYFKGEPDRSPRVEMANMSPEELTAYSTGYRDYA